MIRLLGGIYHFSFLICYPCLFYFHALILVAHWECKLSPFNDIGKDEKTASDFEKILTLILLRGFDLVLSLGVAIPLITPFMCVNWPCILEKECFLMLSSIRDGDFARLFSSSRRYDRVYLSWFILDLVWRLFMMQALRQSVKVLSEFFEVLDDMIGSTLVDLVWIWFGSSLWCKDQEYQ